MLERPAPDEYGDYYDVYVRQAPEGDIFESLAREIEKTGDVIGRIPPELETFRYQPDKWSIREVVGHMLDVERTFAYRALWFARGAPEPLPGMEQDDWAEISNAGERLLGELFAELALTRMANIAMFRSFDKETWGRRGTASGFEFTVRAMPWIVVGHEVHHRKVLEERYLAAAAS